MSGVTPSAAPGAAEFVVIRETSGRLYAAHLSHAESAVRLHGSTVTHVNLTMVQAVRIVRAAAPAASEEADDDE